jgi:hypothetical protein
MPAPFPGSISDPMATSVSNILAGIPFGLQVEVDKGFLIENLCVLLGIGCIRPPKKLKGQTQQSVEDTALTQKIGNTRIVIENVNGGAKGQGRYFNGVIPVLQLGLAPLLMRVCFFMQNFRPVYIQGCRRDPDADAYDYDKEDDEETESTPSERPCRGEVRWYGATDRGLIDVREHVHLWGCPKEIARFNELLKDDTMIGKSRTELAEIVLAEDWPSKLLKEHQSSF